MRPLHSMHCPGIGAADQGQNPGLTVRSIADAGDRLVTVNIALPTLCDTL
jgi:hypothetical protein